MNKTKTVRLGDLEAGATFKIGEREFITFGENDGKVAVVLKNSLFDSEFGRNNNFAESELLKKLTEEFLPEIESAIGAENILEFETDLLSLDGSAKHGVMRSKVSLPTFDFYRKHRAIFEQDKLDEWWWLSTPDSTSEWNSDNIVVCVSPRGFIYDDVYDISHAVRPFCIFVSSISVSCDD